MGVVEQILPPPQGEITRPEAKEMLAVVRSTKRAVRLLLGQSRSTVQALAVLDGRLEQLEQRLNPTAEEAQDEPGRNEETTPRR